LFNHNVAWTGGTFARCVAFAKELVVMGHDTTLVTTSQDARWRHKHLNHEGVHIVEYPAMLAGRARLGWDPWDTFSRLTGVALGELGRPDIVHAFDSRPTVILPALMLAAKSRAPLILDWADWWGRGGTIESRETGRLVRFAARVPETWFEEAFRKRAKRTTVISTALAERARQLGVPEHSITLIPSGCDTARITLLDIAEARQRCGLPQDARIVGYEGTLLRDDASLLVRSFQSLRATDERIQLLLIGTRAAGLSELPGVLRTEFLRGDMLSNYLGACDLFLLPLRDTVANRGRWPSKMNDYLSSGRPTVATPVGDLKRLFSRNEVGLLGWVDDGSFLSACLALLYDPSERARLGRNARTLAETELSWARISETLITVYRDALVDSKSAN
jgi:glycosyltransferase involved in cell wall biosynthesis